MEGEQSEIVGEAASCSAEVQTNKSGQEWASAVQPTDGCPPQCEHEE